MPELYCLVCLYIRPRPGLSEDAQGELEMLTVVNGQMVCLRHIDCASTEGKHRTLMSGVWFESNGTIEGLSAYQDWREKQDRENADG